jgi:hypothetical protein
VFWESHARKQHYEYFLLAINGDAVTAYGKEVTPSPVMSVKEARKRLGKNYQKLTDSQVEDIVSLLSKLAQETIRDLGSRIIC